ncbi:MAG TPA: cytochrome P450 [Acidimicrobiales bacterium]|nr:cytochrome P450 [Acidimicrobiales bacterium]
MLESPDQVNFFDPEVNRCPYPAYQVLRDQAPVWKDPTTGMFVITRHDDIRKILLDPERFTNRVGSAAGMTEKAVRVDEPLDPEEARARAEAAEWDQKIANLYVEKGWPTVPTLDALDPPLHMQLRRMFDHAFRPGRIKELDPFVENLANRLIEGFIDDGRCEWVQQFAVPVPLYTIGRQMGVPEEDMPRIKAWTDAWVQRLGLAQTPEERMWSAEKEIEAQHYFQPIFDRLREHPEDTLLSDLVNKEIPEWGRKLTDNELHSEMMADFFVGGSETTTNALSAGLVILIQHPELWERLSSDLETHLPVFVEEVVRVEGPVQGLLRETAVDVELHGVTIPAGSVVNLRFAAGNRDERHFTCPDQVDLDRKHSKMHLAFGAGGHFCLGAPLARRELYFGFKALFERIEEVWFIEGANDFDYHPNYFLRSLKELHVGFRPR